MPTLIDITPPLVPGRTKVWPGDTGLTREVLSTIAGGGVVTLSTLRATVHLGAHADGPNHYGDVATSVAEMPLERYIGPCHVVEARAGRGRRFGVGDLATPLAEIHHPRVLLRTGTFDGFETFNTDFAALAPELVDALADRGVMTIGTDAPSVDLFDSKDLPAHGAMLRRGIAILEGLALAGVSPGEYELIAPPLRLVGFDGSPVRAVLRAM